MTIDRLFLPGTIGNLEIKNRIIMSPMSTHLVASDGSVTKDLLDYFEARAKGGVGLIITGATHSDMEIARGSITGSNLRIDDHRYIIGLSELTDMIHRYGSKIFVQITLGQGSFCHPFLYPKGEPPIAPSAVKNPLFPKWVPHELSVDEINKIIETFGEAALRAKMAGFDGMELHGHGMYLLSQFMSPFTNKRKDHYGDPATLPLELIKAVKHNVGEDYPISFRWNIDEFLEGGRDLERSKEDAISFEKAGIHLINISGGNFWVPGGATHSCPPMSYQQGHLRQLAKAMKGVISLPVMLSSKIGDPIVANDILKKGQADFIGLGRALLAEPEWPNKVAEGRLDDIRPCIRDMDGCINRVIKYRRIGCTANAQCGQEKNFEIEPTNHPIKVIVVGGGVAGMEAARVAALRGHKVTLFEKSDFLGGQARLAGLIPHKGDITLLIRYLEKQLRKARVVIELGQEASPGMLLAQKPGAVIVATGSRPLVPGISGIDGGNVFSAREVVAGTVDVVGEKIIVAGGGFVGCDTALFLAVKKRKQVTILEQFTFEEVGFEPYDANYMDMMKMLQENNVTIMTETPIEEIIGTGVKVKGKSGNSQNIEADSVVLALGAMAENGITEKLQNKVPKICIAGDCNRPGKIMDAIWQGFHVSRMI